jgi:cytoskeletal protein RodZ
MSSVVDVDSTPPVKKPSRTRLYILIAALLVVVVILGIAGVSKLSGGTSRAQKSGPTLVAADTLPTATLTVIPPTEAPTRKPTNTPVVSAKETDTPAVKATNTVQPASVGATAPAIAPTTAPTKLAAAVVASPTPTPTVIPNTGLGSSGIVIGALLLVVLVFVARRLRVVSES